jgi:hypothetical protein
VVIFIIKLELVMVKPLSIHLLNSDFTPKPKTQISQNSMQINHSEAKKDNRLLLRKAISLNS